MQVVILAAGKGTRMQPLTYDIPKPMLPLYNKPILEYTLEALPCIVDEIIFVVNYLGEHIQRHFGLEWKGRKVHYVLQEELNGTGGALHAAKHLLKDNFLVVMGDDLYYKNDLERLINEKELAILAFEVDDSTRFGVLKTDSDGKLVEIIEKPKIKEKALISTNAFLLNSTFFDADLVPISDTEFGLPQTLASMTKKYPVKILKAMFWYPVGYPEDLIGAEKYLVNMKNSSDK